MPTSLSVTARKYLQPEMLSAGLIGLVAGIALPRLWKLAQRRLLRTSVTPTSPSMKPTVSPISPPSKSTPAPATPTTSPSKPTPARRMSLSLHSTSAESSTSGLDSDSDASSEDLEGVEEHKMVLVVRTDLGMTKGKMAAQCCHAAVAAVEVTKEVNPMAITYWNLLGAAKVALKASSQKELEDLQATAHAVGLTAEVIEDAGRTQIPEGSMTVLAVGPGPINLVNTVTGHLKLL